MAWDHQSCLGLFMWAQHFKLNHHNSNHNSRNRKGDGLRDSYHQAITLRWFKQGQSYKFSFIGGWWGGQSRLNDHID